MAGIQTYPDLLAAITSYLDGEDFDGPTMVQLAEADFRRNIVAVDQEATVPFTTDTVKLPVDCDSVRSLALTDTPNRVLKPLSPAEFADLPASYIGMPSGYLVSNGALSLWPTPDTTYTGRLIYRQTIPALTTDNPTNWLLASHPDAYLFGSLLQAELYGWNDERLQLLQAKLSDTIQSINIAAQRKRYGGGPLVMVTDTHDSPYSRSVAW